MARAIVIFGAAVQRDGNASPTLRRRAQLGATIAQERPQDWIFCSGGVGRFGASEASVIAKLLTEFGLDPTRIVLDEESTDTLENAVAAARFIRSTKLDGAIACTDEYHLPRVLMLFAVLGIRSVAGSKNTGVNRTPAVYRWAMLLRELAAFPYDLAIVLRRRRELLDHISS